MLTFIIAVIVAIWYFFPRTKHSCTNLDHERRLDHVIAHLRRRPAGAKLSLHRRTLLSNTIRNAAHKSGSDYFPVDLSSFNHIMEINTTEGSVTCEPGVLFADLLKELLRYGMTTMVVVELPGISVGGAIVGGALESSSYKYGQFFDSVLELECLTPEKYVCSPSQHSDLFYAISASYNTVALLTKIKMRIHKAPKYLSLEVDRYHSFDAAVTALQNTSADCIEGIAYAKDDVALVKATHTDTIHTPLHRFARHFDRWYYKTIRETDALTVPYWDYCFRYNYGAFWMADYVLDMLGGDTFLLRLLIGAFLDTKHLFAVLHSAKLTDLGRMRVIQDCYVPAKHTNQFLNDIDELIGVYPLWLCPVKATTSPQHLACHHGPSDCINVGIYGRPRQFPFDAPALGNSLIELLIQHQARSMLYAQSWHTRDQFDAIYGEGVQQIKKVKTTYGSDCFYDLYRKVTLSRKEREELGVPMLVSEQEAQKQVVIDIIKRKIGL